MRSPASAFDLRVALSAEIGAAIEALAKGDGGRKAVHACRVRLKRARALARVGHAAAPGLSAVFNDSARTIMRSLAGARDLAALAHTARTVAKHSRKVARTRLKALAEELDLTREALPQIDYAAANAGLRDLLALAQVWPEASSRQIQRGARRVARRARKAWRRGRKSEAPAERHHTWRQREKDRLYAAMLLDDAWPDKSRLGRSRSLIESLGQERDVTMLLRRLEAAPSAAGEERSAAAALRALRRRQVQLARRSQRAGAKVHRDRV